MQPANESGMRVGLVSHDIDILEPGLAVETQIGQVLAEESEPFAEEEYGDESQDDNGHEGVPPEEDFDDRLAGKSARLFRSFTGQDRQARGGGFHEVDDAKRPAPSQTN